MVRESDFVARNADKTQKASSGQLKMILRGYGEDKVNLPRLMKIYEI